MQMFFFLGWGFLLLAFAGAAAEALPRTFPGIGTFVSAHELWYAASPGSLVVTQIQVERISPALWELLRASVLVLPAWMLFGVPGGALVWFCRPHKQMTRYQREELERQEEAIFLFDKLAQEAREAGFDDGEDDQMQAHSYQDIVDASGFTEPYTDDEAMVGEDWGQDGGNKIEAEDGIEDGEEKK